MSEVELVVPVVSWSSKMDWYSAKRENVQWRPAMCLPCARAVGTWGSCRCCFSAHTVSDIQQEKNTIDSKHDLFYAGQA